MRMSIVTNEPALPGEWMPVEVVGASPRPGRVAHEWVPTGAQRNLVMSANDPSLRWFIGATVAPVAPAAPAVELVELVESSIEPVAAVIEPTEPTDPTDPTTLAIDPVAPTESTAEHYAEPENSAELDRMLANGEAIVMFVLGSCGHCQLTRPKFTAAAADMAKAGIQVIVADGHRLSSATTLKYHVGHYPKIALYRDGKQMAVYGGDRGTQSFIDFFHRARTQLGETGQPEQPPEPPACNTTPTQAPETVLTRVAEVVEMQPTSPTTTDSVDTTPDAHPQGLYGVAKCVQESNGVYSVVLEPSAYQVSAATWTPPPEKPATPTEAAADAPRQPAIESYEPTGYMPSAKPLPRSFFFVHDEMSVPIVTIDGVEVADPVALSAAKNNVEGVCRTVNHPNGAWSVEPISQAESTASAAVAATATESTSPTAAAPAAPAAAAAVHAAPAAPAAASTPAPAATSTAPDWIITDLPSWEGRYAYMWVADPAAPPPTSARDPRVVFFMIRPRRPRSEYLLAYSTCGRMYACPSVMQGRWVPADVERFMDKMGYVWVPVGSIIHKITDPTDPRVVYFDAMPISHPDLYENLLFAYGTAPGLCGWVRAYGPHAQGALAYRPVGSYGNQSVRFFEVSHGPPKMGCYTSVNVARARVNPTVGTFPKNQSELPDVAGGQWVSVGGRRNKHQPYMWVPTGQPNPVADPDRTVYFWSTPESPPDELEFANVAMYGGRSDEPVVGGAWVRAPVAQFSGRDPYTWVPDGEAPPILGADGGRVVYFGFEPDRSPEEFTYMKMAQARIGRPAVEQTVQPAVAEPVEPVQPAEPAEPVQPAEPAEPAEPVQPAGVTVSHSFDPPPAYDTGDAPDVRSVRQPAAAIIKRDMPPRAPDEPNGRSEPTDSPHAVAEVEHALTMSNLRRELEVSTARADAHVAERRMLTAELELAALRRVREAALSVDPETRAGHQADLISHVLDMERLDRTVKRSHLAAQVVRPRAEQ
jgi:thiol-disulfide isomerase/thioredoxin